MDSRVFESFVLKTLGETGIRARLHSELGVWFDRNPNPSDAHKKILAAFPSEKPNPKHLYDAPEAHQVNATTAMDIWSLGMLRLRYHSVDVGEIFNRCILELKSFYGKLTETAAGCWDGPDLLVVKPEGRCTAAEACTYFQAAIDDCDEAGSRKGGVQSSPSEKSISEKAFTPGSYGAEEPTDLYGVLSPPVNLGRGGFYEIETDDESVDELKFKFTLRDSEVRTKGIVLQQSSTSRTLPPHQKESTNPDGTRRNREGSGKDIGPIYSPQPDYPVGDNPTVVGLIPGEQTDGSENSQLREDKNEKNVSLGTSEDPTSQDAQVGRSKNSWGEVARLRDATGGNVGEGSYRTSESKNTKRKGSDIQSGPNTAGKEIGRTRFPSSGNYLSAGSIRHRRPRDPRIDEPMTWGELMRLVELQDEKEKNASKGL
ncbi:hypothetical protein ABW19_dt0204262 [Dactylella cylindrospora]|nr:hypothetical protein ABW19_dt0204262 [Dactylella cylindrospora]